MTCPGREEQPEMPSLVGLHHIERACAVYVVLFVRFGGPVNVSAGFAFSFWTFSPFLVLSFLGEISFSCL